MSKEKDERTGEKPTLADVVDRAIREKGYASKTAYLREAQIKGVISNIITAGSRISGIYPFPLRDLHLLTQDLNIPLEELIEVYGKNPFVPPLEEFADAENGIGLLLDWHISFSTGLSRTAYLGEKVPSLGSVYKIRDQINGINPLSLHTLKFLVEDLSIPTEQLEKLYGRDPLTPPLEEYKKSGNAVGKLVGWYIQYRTGLNLADFFSNYAQIFPYHRAHRWVLGRAPIPIDNMKILARDLEIPRHQLIEAFAYSKIVGSQEKKLRARNFARIKDFVDKFNLNEEEQKILFHSGLLAPPIEEIKSDENPLGMLIDWYIGLRTGKSRTLFLEENNESLGHPATVNGWINGRIPFKLQSLNAIVNLLDISHSDLIEIYGTNPLNPSASEFKRQGKKLAQYIGAQIAIKTGKTKKEYLQEKENQGLISNAGSSETWLSSNRTPPKILKKIVDDLQIPYDEVNQFLDYDIAQVKEPKIVDQRYIDEKVEEVTNTSAIQFLYNMAKETGLDGIMASCFSDIIVASDPELLRRRSQVNATLGEYLGQMANGDWGENQEGLLGSIESFLSAYRFLDSVPSIVEDTLSQLAVHVYRKRYGDQDTPLSRRVADDIERTSDDHTKAILGKAKEFFDFRENVLPEVYRDYVKPTIVGKKIVQKY